MTGNSSLQSRHAGPQREFHQASTDLGRVVLGLKHPFGQPPMQLPGAIDGVGV
jgi:hypothetical protein